MGDSVSINNQIREMSVESCISTLNSLGINIERDNKIVNFKDNIVQVQIQMVGDINGFIILELNRECALKVANTMLAGMMTVDDIHNEMTQSVLNELCNMISGNMATVISSNLGIKTDIKPPHLDIRPGITSDKCQTLKYIDDNQIINTYFLTVGK